MNTLFENALDKLTEAVRLICGERGEQHADARLSPDGRYRYLLARQLGFGHKEVFNTTFAPSIWWA